MSAVLPRTATPEVVGSVGGPQGNNSRSTPNLTGWALFGTAALAVSFVAVVFWGPSPNQGIKDAAAALVLISAAAVAIERLLEVFWEFIDATKGSFWPLTVIDDEINALANNITSDAGGPITELSTRLANLAAAGKIDRERAAAARAQLDAAQRQIAEFQRLAPASERGQLVAAMAKTTVTAVASKYDAIKDQAEVATDALDAVSQFIDGVKSNPGRRIISIYAGVALGLILAFVVGFDAFSATFSPTATAVANGTAAAAESTLRWGVAITGVVIGLGSAPTHELIKSLEKLKSK